MTTTTRARLDVLTQTIAAGLVADAKTAANGPVLSKAEAASLSSGLLKGADEALRMRGASGLHLKPADVAIEALETVKADIARINQRTGSGASFVSVDEIKRLQSVSPETAQRAAKAYELITGKRVVLDGTTPPQPPAPAALPDAARVAILDTLVDQFGLARAARVTFSDVVATDGGFKLKIASNVFTGDAFAKSIDGRMITAPAPFSDATYQAVKAKALAYFDSDFKPDMQQWGASTQEIAAARAAWLPERALLQGESDPDGLVSSYPLVFTIDNQSGSDHGVYAGFNPANGDAEVYAFN